MKTAKITIKINDYIIENIGTIDNEVLTVSDDNDNIKYNLQNNILEKENKELKIKLNFKNKKVTYELVKEKQKFQGDLTILSLTNYDKQVIIRYRIEETDFLLEINYETIN